MTKNKPNEHPQKAKAGRDSVQIGRDYTSNNINNTTSDSNNKTVIFWISLVFVGVVTFGTLAWAVNAGLLTGSGNPQQTSTPTPSKAKEITKP